MRFPLASPRGLARAETGVPTLLSMVKFAIPPTLGLLLYQIPPVQRAFGSVGYLAAVAAVLSPVLTPRAAYLEAALCNVLFVGGAAGGAALGLLLVGRARGGDGAGAGAGAGGNGNGNGVGSGSGRGGYSASASAVAGVWLWLMLWGINALKFTRPQFKFASVMASILAIVSLTYAPQFQDTASALGLLRRLFGAMMSGIAIASAVSLCFRPTNCREIVFADMSKYLLELQAVMRAERVFMASVEMQNPFRSTQEAEDVLVKVRALRATHAKLFADMAPAKKEIAYGRLSAADIKTMQVILRRIFLPVVGLSSIVNIFERLATQHGWSRRPSDAETASEHRLSLEYQDIFSRMHEPIEKLHAMLRQAFDHIVLLLMLPGWKAVRNKLATQQKAEKERGAIGSKEFAARFEAAIEHFHDTRVVVLRSWCARHGIGVAPDSFESNFAWITNDGETLFGTPVQRQLFIVLYIEFLEYSAARALLSFVRFADAKVADGTMSRRRLILPGASTVSKWLHTFARSDAAEDSMDGGEALMAGADATRSLWTHTFRGFRKDPEHLPITNPLQHFGRLLRAGGEILRSKHSQFGFRLACAAMSVEIMAFLRQTQLFFVEQRLFWAAIMCAVSMTRTSGEASFIYFLRLTGTFIGAVCCYIIWYVVDGKTPGVLVIYFLFMVGFGYWPVKMPRLALATVIATVTCTLVIGYELQVLKIGTEAATANGQVYYPLYLLAPYRVATTAAGILVAYIFTLFPFPISEGSELRRDLGVALYSLASNYSLVQETVAANISGQYGDLSIRTSAGRKLERARVKLMSRQMLLIQRMRLQSSFTKWQMPLDARFPQKTYDAIIDLVEEMLNFTALTGYATTSFALGEDDAPPATREWRSSLAELQDGVQRTSDEVASLLCLLSSSIMHAQPLPPHLRLPAPYSLLQRLQATNRHILDIAHVAERQYAAFAVLQIASRSIIVDLYKLTDLVKELVGELDFSLPYSATKLSRQETATKWKTP